MSNFSLSSDKLLIFDPNKSRSVCHIYVSRQSPVEEKNLGKLFVLAEIGSPDKINIDIINQILDELKHSYYNTEDLHIETAFEKALERVNQRIADMVGDYDTSWLDKLNIIAIVIKGDQMHFSYVGRLYTFLVRGNRIVNIIETTNEPDLLIEKINPLKAFSNIISGDIFADDSIIFCTSSLLDYVSPEKLKKTVTENQPERAVGLIENLLSANISDTAFGALVIKAVPDAKPIQENEFIIQSPGQATAPVATGTSQSSMEALLDKKERTNQVLTPSISRHLMGSFIGFIGKIGEFIRLRLLGQSPRKIRLEKEMQRYKPIQQADRINTEAAKSSVLVGILKIFKWIIASLAGLANGLIGLFKNKDKVTKSIVEAPKNLSSKTSRTIVSFKKLPRTSKILLLAAVVVAFVIAQSIFTTAFSQSSQEKGVEYDRTISLISQQILNAEAALLYDNEDGAKEMLAQAKSLLDGLPQKTKEQKSEIENLNNNITVILEKTRHMANMATDNLATFTSADTQLNLQGLVLADNSLYTFDPATKTIYSVDIDSKETTAKPQTELKNTFQYSSISGDNILYLNSANGLNEFNTATDELTELEFSLGIDDTNITAMTTYENRLYFLDIKNSKIYRSSKVTGGYNKPAEWMKDDIDLLNGKSITVDGNVYVLLGNGELIKMFQGAKEPWKLTLVDPPLASADKIWTNTDTENLYILDITGQRIIEFTKDGSLVNQYISESFTALKDIAIDYDNNRTYILNGNTIFWIDILK